jgi:ABC-type branched-subunit amino acid transport system ATPase component
VFSSVSQALTSDSDPPLLVVERLRRTYGGVVAVDDCSFAVGAGITAMIGPNGAGKSTVVNLISGTVKPDSGRILFAGQDVTNQPPHCRSRAGLVRTFQLARTFDSLTVLENVMVFASQADDTFVGAIARRGRMRSRDRSVAEEARMILADFGLADKCDDYAGNLSGGQRRLLELARAFMAKPKVLLLDEPTAGVSPLLIDQIKEKLRQFADTGSSVLLIEHNLSVVDELCETAIVMADGRVLAEASMADHRDNREVVDAYLGRGAVR